MAVYLLVGGIWDLRKKEVPVWYLASGTIVVCAFLVMQGTESMVLLLLGAMTGGIFLVLSKATREGVGYGDSWMILILGMYLGIWKLLTALSIAFLCAAVIAGIGVAGKRLKKTSRIPFFPFLALGYLSVHAW